MKITLTLILAFMMSYLEGQNYQTKEIKIRYKDGIEIFTVCTSNPQIVFDDQKEYKWYNEFSKLKSTKGGSGGNLLHGNYRLYDKNGNLLAEDNYYLGLENGIEKKWDSKGKIVATYKYDKGNLIYWKVLDDDGNWDEQIGELLKKGTIRKYFSESGKLYKEMTVMPDEIYLHTIEYHENSTNKKLEFNCSVFDRELLGGKYIAFYENGKIELEGEFSKEPLTRIQIGTWKWYNQDGELVHAEKFKEEIEKWNNGEIKLSGGYIFDDNTNNWVKTGEWKQYSEDGKLLLSEKYKLGVKITD